MLYLLRREGAEDNTKRLRKSPLVSERKEEDGDEENKQLCVNIYKILMGRLEWL
jgi:hypothetical protein